MINETKLKRYRADFWGRRNGAIGVYRQLSVEIEAENREAAIVKMYQANEWDFYVSPQLVELPETVPTMWDDSPDRCRLCQQGTRHDLCLNAYCPDCCKGSCHHTVER